ncbi:MAG: aspartate ammonia-lyase [Armatimonadetes bacterium CG_4_10_14_3_um_filter_66_18]|nr:class II fumarate hydratase [Armatimonadota bacterium]OIP10265.1 MAG: aspartate ammonia-lyase [Armatimonadetes bacterium CG2_30_66_41]PIX46539.1 MAG: aspartate ammonia-lyase [Armatimonadetes bacterium CG_4_8_14_3_um_filter_66_20]PIY51736.1 MAG: aspartate ammonia-lyase [Armatimonadetes bacterium CG_4_10_14_3_um_filter_66_18]PIZ43691.1 MAG: aspartate ammonia-lyase [Armatimonadetes bacterium CG_4_10_14_0_8_um_filter_66_14]PJB69342.1 MAG: aspartate ammonia-lyase [Armatimonadetes bacterium CG_4_
MTNQQSRTERDSLGEVQVPVDALYGAQTQRAVENFPISGIRFSRTFLRALGLIKQMAAQVNRELGLLEAAVADAIVRAAAEVAEGRLDGQFPPDIFQTGSGTSTNMNANEVIASRAQQLLGDAAADRVHPNDHVNMGQSSNDVIPSAIHVAACLEVRDSLLPALGHLRDTLAQKAVELDGIVKTGRTHLMDAMPVRLGQEFSGYAAQLGQGIQRVESVLPRLAELALGGTAVGTGVNARPEFARRVAAGLFEATGVEFREAENHFAAQATQDTAVELSGQLKTVATSLMKIANDLRWMNSGPQAGLGEISLPALQPGSSIMPGKVNPVIPEAVAMVAAQVIGNDVTITIAGQSGSFELNVMLPVLAHNLLQSIELLANAARVLADKAICGLAVNEERVNSLVGRNPILVTALNPVIGYDRAAQIAKRAYAEDRPIREVAREMTDLSDAELDRLLDPRALTETQPGPQ